MKDQFRKHGQREELPNDLRIVQQAYEDDQQVISYYDEEIDDIND